MKSSINGSRSIYLTSGSTQMYFFLITSPLSPIKVLNSKSPNALVTASLFMTLPQDIIPPNYLTLSASSSLVYREELILSVKLTAL
jgi:hypothetical protein